MHNELLQALVILLIGMTTVMVILSLVVAAGHSLIYLTNRWQSIKVKSQVATSIKPEEVVVIASVVNQITKGSGRVLSIRSTDQSIEK